MAVKKLAQTEVYKGAYREESPDIFISYARADVEIVQRLYKMLQRNGYKPWIDVHSIKGGENWLRAIYRAINECQIFLAVLSNNSVSRRGVLQKELKKALDKWEGMLPDDIYIVPLRVDDCPPPELLQDIQIIDWKNGQGKANLLDAITEGLTRSRVDAKAASNYRSKKAITKTTFQKLGWVNREMQELLDRSNVRLLAIDTAVANWICPNEEADWGWKNDNQVVLTNEGNLLDAELPSELRRIGEKYKAQYPDKADSVRYCVTEFTAETPDGKGRLKLHCSPITYLSVQPIMDMLMKPGYNKQLRMRHFQKLRSRSEPLVPNTLDIQVVVITGDNLVLLMKRRSDRELDFLRGRWSASIEEQLNADWQPYLGEDKVFHLARITDHTVFEGFRRALREEVRLDEQEINDSKLRILATGFEFDSLGTSLYATAELPSYLTHRKLESRLFSGEEHDMIAWCPFDSQTLLPVLRNSAPPNVTELTPKDQTRDWLWHPSSRLRIYLALCRRYGQRNINEALGII